MLILIENAGELERLNVLSVLGRGSLLVGLVLDVDGGLDGSLDGLHRGRSHGGCWFESVEMSVDVSKGSGCWMTDLE